MSKASTTGANGSSHGQGGAFPVLYRQPRPLSASLDAGRSLKAASDFEFARGTNSVVVNANEFPFAMRSYPIVFSTSEPRAAIAVLGLADNENLFLTEEGGWRADFYIPAYVRRYPFILIEQPGTSNLLLCIDEGAGLLGEEGERRLFRDGAPTEHVQNALKFCSEFHAHNHATREFVRALAIQGLLTPNEARITMNSGRQMTLRGFEVIDEAKFNALPDDIFLDWRRRGWLHLAWCHFMSMANWARLIDLEAKREPTGR